MRWQYFVCIAALLIGAALIYTAFATSIKFNVYSRFDAGGYSYLYHGGASAANDFVSLPYSNDEREALSGYLLKANFLPGDSTEQKIVKLAEVILDRLDGTRGVPDQRWYEADSYEQFELIWQKELSGIYCTQFRHVYTSLANEAGIPTRIVHSRVTTGPDTRQMKRGRGVSDHNFAESYIAETGDWAFVDLDSKVVLVRGADGRYLNSIDLHDIFLGKRQGNDLELTAYNSSAGTVQERSFATAEDLSSFFAEQTNFRLFFQENQMYAYERNGRSHFFYRPYVAPEKDVYVRKRFYALAGAGALLALAGIVFLLRPVFPRIGR